MIVEQSKFISWKKKLYGHTNLNVTRECNYIYSKSYLAIITYWNVDTADLSEDFWIHLKMIEPYPWYRQTITIMAVMASINFDNFSDLNKKNFGKW